MPFALAHPDAEVIGVDLSPQQIAHGRELVAKIGLKNLDLRAMSLTDIDASFGKFDYHLPRRVQLGSAGGMPSCAYAAKTCRKASPISASQHVSGLENIRRGAGRDAAQQLRRHDAD